MNTVRFKLHEWELEICTEVPSYIQMLRMNLPDYLKHSSQKNRTRKSERGKICFNIYHRTGSEKGITSELNQKAISRLKQHGFCQIVDTKTRNVSTFLNANRKIQDSALYHGGFLYPLFLNLLRFRAALIHASLVSKGNSGILIAGQSGAGKSTLSLSFLRQGFTYFSDEHPIVELNKGKIIGRSFMNRISIPSLSAKKNFPDLKKNLEWNSNIRKFYFNHVSKNGSLSATCSIDKILFPKFHRHGTFSIRRLKPIELFEQLTQDDYFFLNTQDSFKNNLGQNHLRIMMKLAGRAGFVMNYGPTDIGNLPASIENL